jgi:hypothetical protein
MMEVTMTGYFIQYRNETLKKTIKVYSGGFGGGEGTLAEAQHFARELHNDGEPVWRVVKIRKTANGKLQLVSVHRFLKKGVKS